MKDLSYLSSGSTNVKHLKSTIVSSYNEIDRLYDEIHSLHDTLYAIRVQLKQTKSKNRVDSTVKL